ncbi:hypothetical protein L207DRAFT_442099 [Hyaloscypha variabilis F]|uniref:NAD dependent epimerase/dehydratase n=1 Tax=Hyaloscypha variabilis (strain UAMH 11265 / GT02V1 / F) TaxID=1149755 RepID=A0A2J6QZ87_HYAVF|nr:hypothetical protein L207DRAFT_442099 [Hyaloscypha variabilis F]
MATRAVPMEVLCLGMGRTGTQSLADALPILGIKPIYHMRDVRKNEHNAAWQALLERKLAGDKITTEDFDAILGNFAGTTDWPALTYAEELMDAYPNAALILTVRSEDAWLTSMNSTLFTMPSSGFFPLFTNYHFGPAEERTNEIKKAGFREHNENVKKWARERGRELLVFEVKEGWEPLCRFLGKSVPEEGFPRSDDWATKGWKKTPASESAGTEKAEAEK